MSYSSWPLFAIPTTSMLSNKIYTEYEFEQLNGDVILYYYDDEMTEEEKAECKKLPDNITRDEYNELLNKITMINSKHNF